MPSFAPGADGDDGGEILEKGGLVAEETDGRVLPEQSKGNMTGAGRRRLPFPPGGLHTPGHLGVGGVSGQGHSARCSSRPWLLGMAARYGLTEVRPAPH